MTLLHLSRLACVMLLASAVSATPAFAQRDDHGRGHGNDWNDNDRDHDWRDRDDDDRHDNNYKYKRGHRDNVVVISNPDRVVIREYIVNDYRRSCPPGLRKKRNGCMPPGQYKKHYVIGQPLPQYVRWEPVPQPVLVRLRPVPSGYRYVRVDRDVLLISEASHHVIDAITLLSAVGN